MEMMGLEETRGRGEGELKGRARWFVTRRRLGLGMHTPADSHCTHPHVLCIMGFANQRYNLCTRSESIYNMLLIKVLDR